MDEYLIMWNYLKTNRKEKGKGLLCNWARTATVQQAQRGNQPSARAPARAPGFKSDGRGSASVRGERGEGEGRLTGGVRLSSLTLRQRAGELTDDDSGHDRAS